MKLTAEVKGKVPSSLRDQGDKVFEQSRRDALLEMERLIYEARTKRTAESQLEKLYEIKTGNKVASIALKGEADKDDKFPVTCMIGAWDNLPTERKRSKQYVKQAHSRIQGFIDYLEKYYPKVTEMSGVTHTAAKGFLKTIEDKGVSPSTYNAALIRLRSVFHRLKGDAGLTSNPFDNIPFKGGHAEHREPFTEQELLTIFQTAKTDDPLIYPAVVTAALTGMRRKDVCCLRWEDVNMSRKYISRRQSKTDDVVEIPILPPLYDLFMEQSDTKSGEYIFPALAEMYQNNPMGLTYRIQKILMSSFGAKPEKMRDQVVKDGKVLRVKRRDGIRRANKRGFHSFRTTLATMLLNHGASEETVRRIVGHRTIEITREFYFKPHAEETRNTMTGAMPAGLLCGKNEASSKEKKLIDADTVREFVETMTEKNWRQIKEELLAALT